MIAYESARAAQVLAVAGLIAVAAWFAVFAVLAAASRTRNPDVGPPTQELGGKEPAAIVDLITHDWRVSENAPAATLLDLAARRALRLDWIAEDQFIVRARTEPPDLLPYEAMVFQHVRGLMHDDRAVPSAALTIGDGATAARWWKKFRQAVITDAFARGLARKRWSQAAWATLVVTVIPACVLFGAAVTVAPNNSSSSNSTSNSGHGGNSVFAGIFVAFIVGALLLALPRKLRGVRETESGLAAAGRWLALRRYLADDASFGDAPAAAVNVWGAYMAYGAAMGVAPVAVRALPLREESASEAWSYQTGQWRHVHVRYPRRIPFGWGFPTWRVVVLSLLGIGVVGWIVAQLHSHLRATASLALWGGAIVLIVLATQALVLAAGDIQRGRTLRGTALRIRRGAGSQKKPRTWVAVDDGTSNNIRAWLMPAGKCGCREGAEVDVKVSPHLGFIREFATVVDAQHRGAPVVPGATAPAMGGLGPLGAGAIPALDGTAASVLSGFGLTAMPPAQMAGASMYGFLDPAHRRSGVNVLVAPIGSTSAIMGTAIARMADYFIKHEAPTELRQQVPVTGIGTAATWDGVTLDAHDERTHVIVIVMLAALDPNTRYGVAQQVALGALRQGPVASAASPA